MLGMSLGALRLKIYPSVFAINVSASCEPANSDTQHTVKRPHDNQVQQNAALRATVRCWISDIPWKHRSSFATSMLARASCFTRLCVLNDNKDYSRLSTSTVINVVDIVNIDLEPIQPISEGETQTNIGRMSSMS
ncbi:hypothetical protein KCU62_g5723, partial [Aureobasidium sp. EXF-3399]